MKIGIIVLCKTVGGPMVYGINLIKSFVLSGKGHEFIVFTDDTTPFQDLTNLSKVYVKLESLYLLPYWDYFKLSKVIKNSGIQVLHNTKGVLPFNIDCKTIVTIHDMAPFLFPETFPFSHNLYLKYSLARAAQKSDLILTVSENSKRDIVRLLGIREEKVKVVFNGIGSGFRISPEKGRMEDVKKKYNLPDKVLLYLGTLQPRKNIDVIIKAFHRIKREKNIPHKLVVAGRKGWMTEPLFKLKEELGLGDNVIFTGSVSDEELPILYNLADVFIYPSSYEGFGLSVLESMGCGTPVISTNISSLPEVIGDAGILINSITPDALVEAMCRLILEPSLIKELSNRSLERAKLFTWEKAAEKTLECYESVLSS